MIFIQMLFKFRQFTIKIFWLLVHNKQELLYFLMCYSVISYNCTNFGEPKNKLKLWLMLLGIKLKNNSRVCEKHFKPKDITAKYVLGSGVNKYLVSNG